MSSDPSLHALGRLRVLAANSNAYSRSILRMALRTVGVGEVLEADDAPSALRVAIHSRVDLALIEQDSLGLDGPSLAREIRRAPEPVLARLPLVMVAAQANAASVAAARDSGVNAFLLRPISAAVVKARLLTALLDPRPFISAKHYVGPDRRFRSVEQGFPTRRFSDDTAQIDSKAASAAPDR